MSRLELLSILNMVSSATSKNETVEQSDCLIFQGDRLFAFDGDLAVQVTPSPVELSGAVPVSDFVKFLSKFPDDEIEIQDRGRSIRIKGQKRQASLNVQPPAIQSPVTVPSKWKRVPKGLLSSMLQAARTCSSDPMKPLAGCVRIAPDCVEACDDFRAFRSAMKTKLKNPILVPAKSVRALNRFAPKKQAVSKGWLHFREDTESGLVVVVSLRCETLPYPDLAPILGDLGQTRVVLPEILSEASERAEITSDEQSQKVTVSISSGKVEVSSRCAAGWFKESIEAKYEGPDLKFTVNPKFLKETLSKSHIVTVGDNRMRISQGDSVFVVLLEMA